MPAAVIDGKAISHNPGSRSLRDQLKADIAKLKEAQPAVHPKLALIQVGTRSDSSSYIRLKQKAAAEAGIEFALFQFPDTATLNDILSQIQILNEDNSVHGLLVQLPLPEHIDEALVIDAISPKKDVDGLHPVNVGKLVVRGSAPVIQPCTPKGIMALIRSTGITIEGKNATVVGRGDLVGAPMSLLLTAANATVTLCHTKTSDVVDHIKRADILVVAIGQANYVQDSSKKSGYRTVGDVDYAAASKVAGHITPVPGGVGPMTVAMLMDNVYLVAKGSSQ
ncbi:hypothetical protein INT44_005855 [Umbelopsis vinacea]|uniref:Methenyltetrahydrofolate cyclohydrolase n=1 Tax=Umbelopsis vinacea TaxID=44442 RepID=A0A8H7UL54_9FUNG|nr:hypothetical protein INT44_005855 [Umbelopsis vinacea]